jgi:hypothetical protein
MADASAATLKLLDGTLEGVTFHHEENGCTAGRPAWPR